MTGFGRAFSAYKDKKIIFEIRSLNGKTTDLRLRYPLNYKDKEIEIRKTVLSAMERGKIDGTLTIESELGEECYTLNKTLFKKYYSELKELIGETDIEGGDILQSILRIPNVVMPQESIPDKEEWVLVQKLILEAVENINAFRKKEGAVMYNDLKENIDGIIQNLEGLEPYEENRIDTIKTKMRKNLSQFLTDEKIDQNRFEQELLFYLERLDINEEKIRLKQHCKYFLEVMDEKTISKGKKLSFISQEIGREINTLGAKAQEHNIQQHVVSMKDNLERIKEMNANIL